MLTIIIIVLLLAITIIYKKTSNDLYLIDEEGYAMEGDVVRNDNITTLRALVNIAMNEDCTGPVYKQAVSTISQLVHVPVERVTFSYIYDLNTVLQRHES